MVSSRGPQSRSARISTFGKPAPPKPEINTTAPFGVSCKASAAVATRLSIGMLPPPGVACESRRGAGLLPSLWQGGTQMMKLHWSPRSPYVRKVMIAAGELGLQDRLECVRTVVGGTKPHLELMQVNPLGKIPTLELEDGRVLYDSFVLI